MAFGRGKSLTASSANTPARPKSLIASAIRTNLSDISYNLWRFRDEAWQRELWRFYDIIPEFRFAASWVGACCSKVRIYVAEVDALGRVQSEVKDKKINALADTLLGGPASKAEALRLLGIDLTVSGECYIVGRPGKEDIDDDAPRPYTDEWFVLSSSEMRQTYAADGQMQFAWVQPNGTAFRLDIEHNVITRVWTPHPGRVWCADSPARSCQMVLRKIEQLEKYVFSQIDSRLVGAGVLLIPNDLDLPLEDNTTSSADSLMVRLAKAMAASLRGEGSALGVVPHIVETDKPDGWKLLSFESQLSEQAMELRKEAVNQLGVGLDMPPEVLTGLGEQNHWCLSTDTEILTKEHGWTSYDKVITGELVMTLNHDTGESEWQPVQAVNSFDVDEPVLQIESRNHSSISTLNHRWPVVTQKGIRSWSDSGQLKSGQRIPIAAPNNQLPTESKYTDSFVKLVAAYTSDGTPINFVPGNGRPRIHLTKFQPYEISEVRRLLELVCPGQWTETTEHTGTSSAIKSGIRFHIKPDASVELFNVAPGKTKKVTTEFIDSLTEAQLRLFLEAMIEIGDGRRNGPGYEFFQVEEGRLVAIERAAILLGLSVQSSVRIPTEQAFGTRPLHILQVSTRKLIYPVFEGNTITHYVGKVWCPTTSNGTWLARRNGKVFYTGNSGFLIDGYGIKVHIEPLMNRICDALTKAYLYPALKLMGKDPKRYVYAFDTSPLALRPQRLQDALNLYDKGLINGQAVRDAGYFKESEAPTPEEDVQRFFRELMLRDGSLLQNAAIREAAGIPDEILSEEDMIAVQQAQAELQNSLAMATEVPPPGQEGGGGPPPPPPPTGIQSQLPPPIPDTLGEAGMAQPPAGIQASANQRKLEELGIAVVADATVRRGLELAGKRLLDRDTRNQFPDVPAYELHTRIRVQDQARVNRLLNGAWDQLEAMAQFVATDFDSSKLQLSLERYCSQLLLSGIAHKPDYLLQHLRKDGVLHAS